VRSDTDVVVGAASVHVVVKAIEKSGEGQDPFFTSSGHSNDTLPLAFGAFEFNSMRTSSPVNLLVSSLLPHAGHDSRSVALDPE